MPRFADGRKITFYVLRKYKILLTHLFIMGNNSDNDSLTV